MNLLILFAIGAASGIISGMGIGGGAVLIPALFMMGMEQRDAQSVNLIYFLPTAVIALITHVKNDKIEKSVLPAIILAGVPCAVLGAFIALQIDNGMLRKIFGFFLIAMGLMEFFKKSEGGR